MARVGDGMTTGELHKHAAAQVLPEGWQIQVTEWRRWKYRSDWQVNLYRDGEVETARRFYGDSESVLAVIDSLRISAWATAA